MQWSFTPDGGKWPAEITHREAKEAAAAKIAQRLRPGDIVGVGSGSTAFLSLQALAARRDEIDASFRAIATSLEMAQVCAALNVPTVSLREARPDWSFDGADQVDPVGNAIKGRGGALFQEKLVIAASHEPYIVVDKSKLVDTLGSGYYPVPIEVDPEALSLVMSRLAANSTIKSVDLRTGSGKDGPVITERGNVLLDVRFHEIRQNQHVELKFIPGVIETGLFIDFHPTVVVADA